MFTRACAKLQTSATQNIKAVAPRMPIVSRKTNRSSRAYLLSLALVIAPMLTASAQLSSSLSEQPRRPAPAPNPGEGLGGLGPVPRPGPQELRPNPRRTPDPAPSPGPAPATPRAEVAPPAPGPDAQPLAGSDLVALAEGASVFVVAEDGTGSGFFINRNTIVTNAHVVGDRSGGMVRVTSKKLGRVISARVLFQSNLNGREWPDVAFLRTEGNVAPAVVSLSPDINKLDPVVAAGYPGMLLREDRNYRRLIDGDPAAAPELVFERGAIATFQNSGTNLIMHSAFLANGNSGGPLLDPCGRVVGINSAILRDNRAAGQFNVAQDVKEIVREARRMNIEMNYIGGRCRQ